MAGQDFMIELGEDEPMALLILLHCAVLPETLGELWWARGAGERLVEDLVAALERAVPSSGCGSSWTEAVEWARQEAGPRGGEHVIEVGSTDMAGS
ncbi:hypothetical protein B0J14DRAFT_571982 [Halenospora varia]|nr:hypothetical protein B0J14DRAFT_571982 [Halenospora varia]